MTFLVATHSGPFHADDVLAFALIKAFLNEDADVVRTRDPALLATADVVIDVGGVYDPATQRFDHHQKEYRGSFSSAGMVLQWLEEQGKVSEAVAQRLRDALVDYVDDVDNGKRPTERGVPCFATLVGAFGENARNVEEFDLFYKRAAESALWMVRGMQQGTVKSKEAKATVKAAMEEAFQSGKSVLYFETYCKWKPAYFEQGGGTHPTDYVVFPAPDGKNWRVIAIPVSLGSFTNKRDLPAAWAGLTNEALEETTGVPGAVFCHKNRFIAAFRTREALDEALERWGLTHRPAACGGAAE